MFNFKKLSLLNFLVLSNLPSPRTRIGRVKWLV